jgi:hypothetical protein
MRPPADGAGGQPRCLASSLRSPIFACPVDASQAEHLVERLLILGFHGAVAGSDPSRHHLHPNGGGPLGRVTRVPVGPTLARLHLLRWCRVGSVPVRRRPLAAPTTPSRRTNSALHNGPRGEGLSARHGESLRKAARILGFHPSGIKCSTTSSPDDTNDTCDVSCWPGNRFGLARHFELGSWISSGSRTSDR